MEESPKYLVSRGRDEEAVRVLHRIAKYNKQECSLTLQTFEDLANDRDSSNRDAGLSVSRARPLKATLGNQFMAGLARYKLLFNTFPMARLTILIWLTFICDFWGYV